MTNPPIVGTDFGGDGELLLLGPSLGTSATTLWAAAAKRLADHCHVVGWDLPGHGRNRAVGDRFSSPRSVSELAYRPGVSTVSIVTAAYEGSAPCPSRERTKDERADDEGTREPHASYPFLEERASRRDAPRRI